MVAVLDVADSLVKRLPGAVNNHKKFILPGLPNDRLRLQLGEVDATFGEYLQYLDEGARLVVGGDDQRSTISISGRTRRFNYQKAGDIIGIVVDGTL